MTTKRPIYGALLPIVGMLCPMGGCFEDDPAKYFDLYIAVVPNLKFNL